MTVDRGNEEHTGDQRDRMDTLVAHLLHAHEVGREQTEVDQRKHVAVYRGAGRLTRSEHHRADPGERDDREQDLSCTGSVTEQQWTDEQDQRRLERSNQSRVCYRR